MVLSSQEMQTRLIQTTVYYKRFYSVWKKRSHKPLKEQLQESLSQVCILLIQLASRNIFYSVITGRYYFLYKFIVTQRFGVNARLMPSLKQVFWKKSAFYTRYFHNNITMLLVQKIQNKTLNVLSKIYLLIAFF